MGTTFLKTAQVFLGHDKESGKIRDVIDFLVFLFAYSQKETFTGSTVGLSFGSCRLMCEIGLWTKFVKANRREAQSHVTTLNPKYLTPNPLNT